MPMYAVTINFVPPSLDGAAEASAIGLGARSSKGSCEKSSSTGASSVTGSTISSGGAIGSGSTAGSGLVLTTFFSDFSSFGLLGFRFFALGASSSPAAIGVGVLDRGAAGLFSVAGSGSGVATTASGTTTGSARALGASGVVGFDSGALVPEMKGVGGVGATGGD